ncbi:hypothetical protein [Bacillus sp. B1-b2]|uniref:hypothetical protein n=1 Tax=Bacillus sp. B1-b2 TaxID=2653201 RepID=UPI001261E721|nr:hypothetical protein [Bacillus sp. B1-b2]KAB7672087.1 hypothetical protein F9279_03990 [Bacillus sp. B1-b2]
MGRKKRHIQSSEQMKHNVANRKRARIIYGFLIVMIAFVLAGVTFSALRILFATNLYHAFIYDWVGTVSFYLAGMTLLVFFIYFCLVITIKNPQKVSKIQVFSFGGFGLICLAISIVFFPELSSFTINGVRDMKDYSNGVVKIEDLKVVDVYTGGDTNIALIATEEEELTLLIYNIQIEEGETYRFTYMERTGNILNVEEK